MLKQQQVKYLSGKLNVSCLDLFDIWVLAIFVAINNIKYELNYAGQYWCNEFISLNSLIA